MIRRSAKISRISSQEFSHKPGLVKLASPVLLYLAASLSLVSCASASRRAQGVPISSIEQDLAVTRIAFGSCAHQDKPQVIWRAIEEARPEMLLLLGDNIYGDTHDPKLLRAKYRQQGEDEGFRKLRAKLPIWATWDDHDYGLNDEGAENPNKVDSQKAFLEFFEEPADSVRFRREGVYDSRILGPVGKRVQIILLDTRYFRGPLTLNPKPVGNSPAKYVPSQDPSSSMLGEAQWQWLEAELRKPAELRILVSSIQVVAQHHGWEKWNNLPHERQRLFDLISRTGAKNVFFISGDRHRASLAREEQGVPYPFYDLTSSALANPLPDFLRKPEPDPQQLGPLVWESNFGLIQMDWKSGRVSLEIRNADNKVVLQHELVF
jgi:alkaline phosphatase D